MTQMLEWSDGFCLGYGPMDKTHEEFVQIVGEMQRAPNEVLSDLLAQLLAHTEEHFAMENAWMIETQFPPRECHIEQHKAVLQSIQEVQALLCQGDFDVCRRLVDALVDWFPSHATHLDSALAHWMFKRRYGGKPVVLQRRASQPETELLSALSL